MPMNYGELMKDIRFDYDVKQKEMAAYLEIATSTYNIYEQQYDIIPLKYLIKFCDYFHISLDYMFGFTKTRNNHFEHGEYNYKEVGKNIRKIRKESKLTQEEFAKIVHSTPSSLCRYERGKILISTSTLYEICKRFNVSADLIIGRFKKEKIHN